MVFDAARSQIVLFGGTGGTTSILDDTWTWSGINWAQRSPVSTPPARYSHAMAYDESRREVVMFGGNTGSATLNDTWTWKDTIIGMNWAQKNPLDNPLNREGHAIAYDSARSMVVLFGGHSGTTFYGDTWIWPAVSSLFLPAILK